MKNYNFNGMNANEIADKIIAREEAYANTDFDSLSLEDKCRFVREYRTVKHISKKLIDLDVKQVQLYKELAARVENEENALYLETLSILADRLCKHDAYGGYLVRAKEAGSLIAKAELAILSKNNAEDVLIELIDVLSRNAIDDELLCACCDLLIRCGRTSEEREKYKPLYEELILKSVLRGEYHGLVSICNKGFSADMSTWNDEKVFWKTVDFLVTSYFYDKYSVYGILYGVKLIRGIGCDPDFDRAKRFYVDAYLRKTCNKDAILDRIGVKDRGEADLIEAREAFRAQGDADGYRNAILIGVIQKDAAVIEAICDEAIAKCPESLMNIMPKAYEMLYAIV